MNAHLQDGRQPDPDASGPGARKQAAGKQPSGQQTDAKQTSEQQTPAKQMEAMAWRRLRRQAWERDGRACVHCRAAILLSQTHTDPINPSPRVRGDLANLRTLCRRCYILRGSTLRQRGRLIATALRDGVIPRDWRDHVWDEG